MAKITVKDTEVSVIKVNEEDYICITDMIKAEEKPESTYTSTRRKDIYNDWFESEKEAQEYVEQTRIA